MARYVKEGKIWLGASVLAVALALPAAAASLSGLAAAQRAADSVMRDHDFSSSIRAREPDGARGRAPLDQERDKHLGRKHPRRVFLPGLYYVPDYDPGYDEEPDVPLGPETAGPDNSAPPPPEKPAESKTVRIPSGARFMPIPGAVSAPDISDDQSPKTSHAETKSPRHHLLARHAGKEPARQNALSARRD